jgi:hypothetical protein
VDDEGGNSKGAKEKERITTAIDAFGGVACGLLEVCIRVAPTGVSCNIIGPVCATTLLTLVNLMLLLDK